MSRSYRWTPEGLAARRAANRRNLQRPEVRAKRAAALQRPEVRAKMAAAARATWQRPEVRAKMAAAARATWQRPEVRAKRAAAQRARLAPLAKHQRSVYAKLIRCGIDRERAFAEALKSEERQEAGVIA